MDKVIGLLSRSLVLRVAALYEAGKLNFRYVYNPLYTMDDYDESSDHEFHADYNGLEIRLGPRVLIVTGKSTRETAHALVSGELPAIYAELSRIYSEDIALNNRSRAQSDARPDPMRMKLDEQKRALASFIEKLSE